MSKADICAVILWAGATLYALFGGADFGAGAVSLITRRERELGPRLRARIGHSLGPVWEANHVWLIFCLVVLWTAFPDAFGPIMESLYLPLALAALGIVLRGSGFAFGHAFQGKAHERADLVFAGASVVTPFFMGCVVGAIASGEVVPGASPGPFHAWLDPLPLTIGVLFVVASSYLAAVFLVADAARAGEADLREWFRRTAIVLGVVAGALAVVGIFALRADARYVFDGLTSEGLPLLIASGLLGALALGALITDRPGARPLAAGAVVAVIWGWGVGQHPYLLPEKLTISAAAGADGTLTAVIIVFIFALAIVGPALAYLYRLSQAQLLE